MFKNLLYYYGQGVVRDFPGVRFRINIKAEKKRKVLCRWNAYLIYARKAYENDDDPLLYYYTPFHIIIYTGLWRRNSRAQADDKFADVHPRSPVARVSRVYYIVCHQLGTAVYVYIVAHYIPKDFPKTAAQGYICI